MSRSAELAVAVAAGVGLGAAAAYFYYGQATAQKPKPPAVQIQHHHDEDLARKAAPTLRDLPPLPTKERTRAQADKFVGALSEARSSFSSESADSSSNLSGHHLSTWQDAEDTHKVWPRPEAQRKNLVVSPMAAARPHMNFLNPNEKVSGSIILNDSKAALRSDALADGAIRGNACKHIWWEPSKVKAALVTCGGLCPGLNSIIQGVTNCLWRDYGVRQIVGITAGYNGLSDPSTHAPITLTPELVEDIHMRGGSILKAGRGGFDAKKIVDTLRAGSYTHLFVIGGDGTQCARVTVNVTVQVQVTTPHRTPLTPVWCPTILQVRGPPAL
jgi:hypothetical protein